MSLTDCLVDSGLMTNSNPGRHDTVCGVGHCEVAESGNHESLRRGNTATPGDSKTFTLRGAIWGILKDVDFQQKFK